MTPIFHLNNHA